MHNPLKAEPLAYNKNNMIASDSEEDPQMAAWLAQQHEVLITRHDWRNDASRGSLVICGAEHAELIATVRRYNSEDYRLDVDKREVRTGQLDENDKRVYVKKETIQYLSLRRCKVPEFVRRFRDQVDHPILREERRRHYNAEVATSELNVFGDSNCQVRGFTKLAKAFAYKLSKVPSAKKRKAAVRAATVALDKIIYDATVEPFNITPNEPDSAYLQYTIYNNIRTLIQGDCFLTKHLATLQFSEDTSCNMRLDPHNDFVVTYPSKRHKCTRQMSLPQTLQVELRQLYKIRQKQNTDYVFVNPNSRCGKAMSYSSLTKYISRYAKKRAA